MIKKLKKLLQNQIENNLPEIENFASSVLPLNVIGFCN